LTLVADVEGSGPAVVLLHGQPGTAADWAPVARLLRSSHTVVVPDRLGYGRTGGPAGGFKANADAVLRLLDGLAVERAVVVGHSWGGGVALALVEDRPDRVAGAVLLATVVPDEPIGRLDRLLAVPAVGSAVTAVALGLAGRALTLPRVRQAVERMLRGTTEDGLLAVAESWRQGESWRSFVVEQRALVEELGRLGPGLAGIALPVIIMTGSADRIVPPSAGGRLAAAIPGAELIRLEGAGHLLTHERPEEVAAAVARLASAG
jgi:pimeloyl-ACP methyl ester carboxylesterase